MNSKINKDKTKIKIIFLYFISLTNFEKFLFKINGKNKTNITR